MISFISYIVFAVASLIITYGVTRYSDVDQFIHTRTKRLTYGVPWGTLIFAVVLISVFFIVQRGYRPGGPTVVGFRAWSITYIQGWVFSSITHLNTTHLIGNVMWLLVFGSLAEYVWGHYPFDKTNARGNVNSTSNRVLDTPLTRVSLFLAAFFAYGFVSSILLPGATIGASGIVFVCIGIVVAVRPLLGVSGVVVAEVLQVILNVVMSPVAVESVTRVQRSTSVTTVDQGHIVGFLAGVLIGVGLIHRRNREKPSVLHVWCAGITVSVFQSLHTISWASGEGTVIVLQGIGLATVGVLMVGIALGVAADDHSVISAIDLSLRETTLGFIIAVLLAFSIVGLSFSFVNVTDSQQKGVEVDDYTVWYADGAPNQYQPLTQSIVGGNSGNTSGVHVTSPDRTAWHVAVSPGELAKEGSVTVPVGGAFSRVEITVVRESWTVIDGGTVYSVSAERGNGSDTVLFNSGTVESNQSIAGNVFELSVIDGKFVITATSDETTISKRVPRVGGEITLDGVTVRNEDGSLYVKSDGTRILLAEYGS